MRGWLSGLVALGCPVLVAAQGTEPLRKTDLIRLLSNPVIRKAEVADLVRRNCLAFRPTERDWADLRSLGAGAEVLGSVGSCITRSPPPSADAPAAAPEPAPPRSALAAMPAMAMLEAVPLPPRVTVVAGTD